MVSDKRPIAIAPSRLARRLNTSDAVVIGLGSMIGAGVFAVIGPAAQAAGSGLLLSLFIAGTIAYLNATTMAQLAAIYPESGGTYVYGRRLLGPLPGFLAGWSFVIGKLASCTAMALTFGYYVSPDHAREFAVGAVAILTAINCLGVRKTATTTKTILVVVLLSLGVVVLAALGGGATNVERLKFWEQPSSLEGVLQSAGLIFFAFAGYARVATLGEEVMEPSKTIPRAILIALGVTLIIYVLVFLTAMLSVDIDLLANSKSPLVLAIESGQYSQLAPFVRIGACFASLGVLLSLMAGVGRTAFAMAANKDLPVWLSKVHSVHRTPYRAEILVGLIIIAVVGFADLRSAIGFSSFAILIYYAIANVSALMLERDQRRWPKWMCFAGLVSCLAITACLPWSSVGGGLLLFGVGAAVYFVDQRIIRKL